MPKPLTVLFAFLAGIGSGALIGNGHAEIGGPMLLPVGIAFFIWLIYEAHSS